MAAVLAQGYLQVYTGNGKGKTTAAIGAALRATQRGLKVAFVQFLKSGYDEGTIALIPNITYQHFGIDFQKDGWFRKGSEDNHREIPETIKKGWEYAKTVISSGEFDLVILDELNIVLFFDLLDIDEVICTLKRKPLHVELIVTGRQAPEQLRALADLVTDMHEVKHWYHLGTKARIGIEY